MSHPTHPPVVGAVIATYRRIPELLRLLGELFAPGAPVLEKVVVADNAADPDLPVLLRRSFPGRSPEVLPLPENEGPGTAWDAGLSKLRKDTACDVFFVLDDDVILRPEAASQLLKTMQSTGAAVVAPLLSDDSGALWGFPEPREPGLQKKIRSCKIPADVPALLGNEPVDAVWCTGACLLVTRDAIGKCGSYRRDFFMLGEDLEFTMRVSNAMRVVFDPLCEVPHLPPSTPATPATRLSAHRKFCALLQNLAYISFHLPHRHHMRRYLAGNFKRFFLQPGLSSAEFLDGLFCFYAGALRGQPSGGPLGKKLRVRMSRRVRQ